MTAKLIARKYRGLIAAVCLLLLMGTITMAQSTSSTDSSGAVPQLVKFTGVLKDNLGHAKTGMTGITFALYKEQYDGTPLWLETQNVEVDGEGNYTVLLGSTKGEGIPTDLFGTGEQRWLGVQVEGQAEQPRILFVSVPYALRASDAATIGGLPPSAFLRAPTPGTSGTNNASTPLGTAATLGTAAAGKAAPPVSGSGKTDFIPIWTSSSTLGDSTMFETGGKVGIGTTGPIATLDVAGTAHVSGAAGIGVAPGAFQLLVNAPNQLGEQVQGPFTGVGAGLQFETTGAGGKGWELLATGKTAAQGPSKLNIRDLSTGADVFTIAPGGLIGINNTNPGDVMQITDKNLPCCAVGTVLAADAFKVGTAVFGDVTQTSGLARGVFGQIFSPVNDSAAVIGEAQGASGQTSGVAGFNQSSSTLAAGVIGAEGASSGTTLGVSGSTSSPKGTGVLGVSVGMSNTGNALVGCCAFGVWGDTRSNVFGDAALIGTADAARAIYLQNNSTVVPTAYIFQGAANQPALQVGGVGGLCEIDSNGNSNCNTVATTAPLAGGQRHVALYAMASPQHWFEDFGAGRLENGTAAVVLDPAFAETVNGASDYHVFLTPEGDCRGLYVSSKTASGFEVRELGGGRSTVAFDYRIVALRRGFENVRLEDVTQRWNKMNTPMPTPASGPQFKLPSPPPAPRLAESNVSEETQLNAQQ